MAQEPLSMRPETVVELSQLVSLLEAPAFAPLRLQLLQPAVHPTLLRAAHGLLMLLPQVLMGDKHNPYMFCNLNVFVQRVAAA